MKPRVRRPAILFALFSAIYGMMVQGIWQVAFLGLAPSHPQPFPIWLVTSLPAIVYAVICLLFCHWLARRVARQIAALPKD